METPTSLSPAASNTPPPTPLPLAELALPTSAPQPRAERVLIISFDGLPPAAIGKAPMTRLIRLMENSAWSLSAQTILPSSTLPAHTSMLSGMCPARHGVYWNDFVPENGYAQGVNLFDLAHAAGLRTVMLVGKEKLRQIVKPESTDVFTFKEDDSTLDTLAVLEIRDDFGLMFVHFPSGDISGHEYGWMGAIQMWNFRQDDKFLGAILDTLEKEGLLETTLIILTADHGGYQHSHGGELPQETTIPWIVSGPGVIPGPLASFIQITDTAATAAFMLGLPIPAEWDGVPVYEAFGLPTPLGPPAVCMQTR
jgi:arylsulfatase A-like enzyme